MSSSPSPVILVATVCTTLSWSAEIWFLVCMRIWSKKETPLERMLQYFCLLHGIAGIFYASGAMSGNCVVLWIAAQFWATSTWFLSFFIGLFIVLACYKDMKDRDFTRIQYLVFSLTLVIPGIICVILATTNTVTLDTSVPGAGSKVAGVLAYPGLFFLILLANMVMFFMVFYRIRTMKREENLSTKQKKIQRKWSFYAAVFMCMGLWRTPGTIYYIYRSAGWGSPLWTQILLQFFLPIEGFVMCMLFGWYFKLFKRCGAKCGLVEMPESSSTTATDTESISATDLVAVTKQDD